MLVIWLDDIPKQLIDWHFLERGDAQQLQDCVEAGIEIEPLFDNGDEHASASVLRRTPPRMPM